LLQPGFGWQRPLLQISLFPQSLSALQGPGLQTLLRLEIDLQVWLGLHPVLLQLQKRKLPEETQRPPSLAQLLSLLHWRIQTELPRSVRAQTMPDWQRRVLSQDSPAL
jgi:hypothetical protein